MLCHSLEKCVSADRVVVVEIYAYLSCGNWTTVSIDQDVRVADQAPSNSVAATHAMTVLVVLSFYVEKRLIV